MIEYLIVLRNYCYFFNVVMLLWLYFVRKFYFFEVYIEIFINEMIDLF